ncbi:MAG: RNA polymerase sigma factor [Myxococcaceae bacterium]
MVPVTLGQPSINLDQLYAGELPCVYSFLYRLGGRGGDLEDLAHDVFVTAVRRWSSYDPSRPVRPWLLGITFRVMADFKRKRTSDREVPGELVDVPDEAEGAEARVHKREARELIDEALESLEGERRAVFVMHELEGVSAADISAAMGSPLATTYSRLRVGREEFTAAVRRIQLRRGEP